MRWKSVLTLRGPSTLTWELRTGESKTTLEDKTKLGNVTYYISSESVGILIKPDAYHRRKQESRIRTSTALIAREINMRELKQNSQHFS